MSQALDYQVKFGPLGAVLDPMVMRRKLNAAIAGGQFSGFRLAGR